jgi:hypothetical protein
MKVICRYFHGYIEITMKNLSQQSCYMPKLELRTLRMQLPLTAFVKPCSTRVQKSNKSKNRNLARNHKSVCACYVKYRWTTLEYVKLIASLVPPCWFSVQVTVQTAVHYEYLNTERCPYDCGTVC